VAGSDPVFEEGESCEGKANFGVLLTADWSSPCDDCNQQLYFRIDAWENCKWGIYAYDVSSYACRVLSLSDLKFNREMPSVLPRPNHQKIIYCPKCGNRQRRTGDEFDFEQVGSRQRRNGLEVHYSSPWTGHCLNCHEIIDVLYDIWEYPEGHINRFKVIYPKLPLTNGKPDIFKLVDAPLYDETSKKVIGTFTIKAKGKYEILCSECNVTHEVNSEELLYTYQKDKEWEKPSGIFDRGFFEVKLRKYEYKSNLWDDEGMEEETLTGIISHQAVFEKTCECGEELDITHMVTSSLQGIIQSASVLKRNCEVLSEPTKLTSVHNKSSS
jgi:hypothetical protein